MLPLRGWTNTTRGGSNGGRGTTYGTSVIGDCGMRGPACVAAACVAGSGDWLGGIVPSFGPRGWRGVCSVDVSGTTLTPGISGDHNPIKTATPASTRPTARISHMPNGEGLSDCCYAPSAREKPACLSIVSRLPGSAIGLVSRTHTNSIRHSSLELIDRQRYSHSDVDEFAAGLVWRLRKAGLAAAVEYSLRRAGDSTKAQGISRRAAFPLCASYVDRTHCRRGETSSRKDSMTCARRYRIRFPPHSASRA